MIQLFLKLAVGHCLADYPLQGDFLAKAKNHKQPIPGIPWYQALAAHSTIQGGMVWFLTGSVYFGLAEFCAHALCDWYKNEGQLSFNQDQVIHIACKLLWAVSLTVAQSYAVN